MPSSQAHVTTDRAQRYVTQLCGHLGRLRGGQAENSGHSASHGHRPGHTQPPDIRRVEGDGGHGRIDFDWGQILLDATPDALLIAVTAADGPALGRAETLIAHRLQTIGHRDHLTVAWRRTP